MRFEVARGVRIAIAQSVLNSIFDECDRFDDVETGGRIIGTYKRGRALDIHVSGVIDAGPKAQRARTSFFQDGDYQEAVFREVERRHAAIEHLGTWHTHHVNGYPHLSAGDLTTYHRTVNHPQHNLDFWYALLVTERVAKPERYMVKHYMFLRGDREAYEVPARSVRVVQAPALWVPSRTAAESKPQRMADVVVDQPPSATERRAADDRVLRSLFTRLRPFVSAKTGALTWKGQIELIDSSSSAVVVTEIVQKEVACYEASIAKLEEQRFPTSKAVRDATPWLAMRSLEASLNRHLAGFDAISTRRAE